MNMKKINRSLKKVARRNGVSVEEVRREIELALTLAQSNSNPKIQAFWKSMPSKNAIPTTEEALAHIVNTVEEASK